MISDKLFMRITTVYIILYALLFLFGLTGCASLIFPNPKITKAKDLKFVAPATPYSQIKNDNVDFVWQNSKNGNSLAFLSECSEQHDPALKTIEAENLSALSNIQIIDSKNETYNDRESLQLTTDGQVDGIPIRMSLVIFKKNSCSFTITYVGRQKHFASDLAVFKTFKENFKVP